MWWHPYGQAMLPEHCTVVLPMDIPWIHDTQIEYLDQALVYNWLDQANMYHVMMETGNFIYATACKLLGACSYASSHYQILSTVSSACVWVLHLFAYKQPLESPVNSKFQLGLGFSTCTYTSRQLQIISSVNFRCACVWLLDFFI